MSALMGRETCPMNAVTFQICRLWTPSRSVSTRPLACPRPLIPPSAASIATINRVTVPGWPAPFMGCATLHQREGGEAGA
jgi:hypothetical protein